MHAHPGSASSLSAPVVPARLLPLSSLLHLSPSMQHRPVASHSIVRLPRSLTLLQPPSAWPSSPLTLAASLTLAGQPFCVTLLPSNLSSSSPSCLLFLTLLASSSCCHRRRLVAATFLLTAQSRLFGSCHHSTASLHQLRLLFPASRQLSSVAALTMHSFIVLWFLHPRRRSAATSPARPCLLPAVATSQSAIPALTVALFFCTLSATPLGRASCCRKSPAFTPLSRHSNVTIFSFNLLSAALHASCIT